MQDFSKDYLLKSLKDENIYIKEAKDLPQGIEIPTTATYINKNEDYPISDNYIKLLAWIITEGNIDKESECIWITQSVKENKNYVDDIRNCLINENITHSEYLTSNDEIKRFRIFKNEPKLKSIKELLNTENFHIIPRWILKDFSQRQLLLFYDTLINGDGSRKKDTNGETFYTILKKNADAVQELGILLGYSTKCRFRRNCWEVFLNKNRQFRTIQSGDIGLEDYSGIVWCIETNNHTFIARRDGVPFITGNSVAVVDLENQYIPLEVLKKGIQSLLSDLSYANLMIMHKNIQVGKIISSYGKYKTGVDKHGLMIVAEIRKDIKVADEIWGLILKKELASFSIGCEVLLSHKVCDNKECITILDKINIFEVSICQEGINQESKFVVVSKSDYEKLNTNVNVLNVDNIGIENMADEIKKDATPCTNCTEPIELSIEERLESLEKLAKNINDFMELAKKKPEEEVPPTPCKDEKKADPVPPFPPVEQPTGEQPVTPPEEEKPEEMDMAVFMLDYIIRNPKSTAQDIAKAWMKKSQKSKSFTATEQVPVPVVSPQDPVMESLMKKVDTLSEKISKLDYTEELKSSLKVRDDAIQALEKKIEIITKSKEPEKKVEPEVKQEIKTVQATIEPVMEKEELIHISNGIVTSSEFM